MPNWLYFSFTSGLEGRDFHSGLPMEGPCFSGSSQSALNLLPPILCQFMSACKALWFWALQPVFVLSHLCWDDFKHGDRSRWIGEGLRRYLTLLGFSPSGVRQRAHAWVLIMAVICSVLPGGKQSHTVIFLLPQITSSSTWCYLRHGHLMSICPLC